MAKHVNSQQAKVLFVDLEEEDDDEVIELLPPNSHSESVPRIDEVEETDETIENIHQNEPDRKKIIQQCLALLLHAQKCDIVHEEMSEVQIECVVPQCSTAKELLQHQESCREGKNCTVQNCSTSKMILTHWTNCKRENCQLCSPLREKFTGQLSTEPEVPSINTNKELAEPEREPDADANIEFSSSCPSFSRAEIHDHVVPENNNLVLNIFASSRAKVPKQPDSESTPLNSPLPMTHSQPEMPHSQPEMTHLQPVMTHLQPEMTPTNPDINAENRPRSNFDYNSRIVALPRWKTHPNRFPCCGSRCHAQRSSYRRPFNSGSNSNRSFNNRQFNSTRRHFQQYRNVSSGQRRDSRSNGQFRQTDGNRGTQHQVMMLVHACKCQKREERNIGPPCTSQACKVTKVLLDHVKVCRNTARCSFQRCISSKRLLLHLNQCIRADCSLCSPLRRKFDRFSKARGNSSNLGNGSFSGSRSFGEQGNLSSQIPGLNHQQF